MNEKVKSIIPENVSGKAVDVEHSVMLPNIEEAKNTFKRAYKRLLNVSLWHEIAGAVSADFVLTDDSGNEVHRLAEEGDYLKIDIPGPGLKTGEGYDWVQVEKIVDNSGPDNLQESIAMRVCAAKNPQTDEDATAHFFKDGATSTFIIEREDLKVTATYYGRNEAVNTETGKTIDNLRNTVVGGAALAAGSKLQWDALMKKLLEPEIGG
jgi:hypothetical protein